MKQVFIGLTRRAAAFLTALAAAWGLLGPQGPPAADVRPDFTSAIAASALDIPGTGVAYGRVIELAHSGEANAPLIAVYEDYSVFEEGAGYPFYISRDAGRNWTLLSLLVDPVHSGECLLKWQPEIYELPRAFGSMPAGTLLFAGVCIDPARNKLTKLQLYRSADAGLTWEYLSTVATAGGIDAGIWEPELQLTDDGALVCYYSDETQKNAHSQRLVYRTSTDAMQWSSAAEVVALIDPALRPGMPGVVRLHDGSWLMTYELIGQGGLVYCKTSPDGLDWGLPYCKGTLLYALEREGFSVKKYTLACTPCCAWTPCGADERGTIVVTGMFLNGGASLTGEGADYFVSGDSGRTWRRMRHPLPYRNGVDHAAYSNSMSFSADGKTMYSINSVPLPSSSKCVMTFASTRLDG